MRRVSHLPESSEVCFIDSSGVHTIDGARFFFILCNTPVGGIPIGAILISSDSEDLLTEAFQIFQVENHNFALYYRSIVYFHDFLLANAACFEFRRRNPPERTEDIHD